MDEACSRQRWKETALIKGKAIPVTGREGP
jgi:hypothetical protein